jgi:hypothetical protein
MVLHLEERGCRRARRFPVETIERLFELGGEPMPFAVYLDFCLECIGGVGLLFIGSAIVNEKNRNGSRACRYVLLQIPCERWLCAAPKAPLRITQWNPSSPGLQAKPEIFS